MPTLRHEDGLDGFRGVEDDDPAKYVSAVSFL